MAKFSTQITVTTAATPLISTATTWANIRFPSAHDPVPFQVFNTSTLQSIRYGGSSSLTSATMRITPEAYYFEDITYNSPRFALTTGAGISIVVEVEAERQG